MEGRWGKVMAEGKQRILYTCGIHSEYVQLVKLKKNKKTRKMGPSRRLADRPDERSSIPRARVVRGKKSTTISCPVPWY